ncbi:hypothetical protein [Pedobacter sp.]|uniref:hypothetical protein n=1 Tax=Pedobacter sp. TaxID=1411316 RepID=UPI003D7FDA69
MALLDHNGESEFPFSKNQVFDALCIAIPSISGLKIEKSDKLMGRVLVKAGVSLASWGENIPIQLIEISESKTKIQITSSPKTGILMGGAFDMGKNRKNIEDILSATSNVLANGSLAGGFHPPLIKPKKKLTVGKVILYVFLGFIALGILRGMFANSTTPDDSTSTEASTTQIENVSPKPEVQADPEDNAILLKLKAKAKEDWPDDYSTQEFWVHQEMEDYQYMKTIKAGPIKRKAQRDWPLDFSTQKFWYNEQIQAKERMN